LVGREDVGEEGWRDHHEGGLTNAYCSSVVLGRRREMGRGRTEEERQRKGKREEGGT
jgi:hypothetical protein